MRASSVCPFLFSTIAVLAFACGGQPPLSAQTAIHSALPAALSKAELTPPGLRLPTWLKPTSYAVTMHMSPLESHFTGKVTVTVSLTQPSAIVWIHAGDNLTVQTASVGSRPARIVPGADEMIGLAFDGALTTGTHVLTLSYVGTLPTRDGRGAYRQIEPEASYIYTQFESTDARRAFPCFDEPGFKTPFALTLEVPQEQLAFANAPQTSETRLAGGYKSVTFATSKPLPSYLVAFAVGPFEVVDGGKAGANRTPIRIIVPKGKSAEATYAAATTGKVLERLETYFGIPYPYEKLDHIAVPQKRGAMENPGLITFGNSAMLGKPEDKSVRLERGYIGIAAHELGHIWFGDYVTTAWWDDIWLNEAFATWIAAKVVEQLHPEWDGAVRRVQSKTEAMLTDSLVTTRRIRQPIASKHDIANAFDSITYEKGGAVIGMFESFVGEAPFRKAVQAYLERHAHGNASATDFLNDVGERTGHADIFAQAFSTFLDQPGLPLVTAELSCIGTPKLLLSQQRYVPRGSSGGSEELWTIPVCASYEGGKSCTVMSRKTAELTLNTRGATCPAWVNANADATGYYRVAYKGDLRRRLLEEGNKALPVHERFGVFSDAIALVKSGQLQEGEVLALVPNLVRDGNRHLVGLATRLTQNLDSRSVLGEFEPNYRRFVAKTFGPRAVQLGWTPKPGDDDGTRLLRPSLLSLVARDSTTGLSAEARKLTLEWLQNREAIDHDMVSAVLATAAYGGDRTLWTMLRAEAAKTQDRTERGQLLAAMGSFRDANLVADNFALLLSDEFDPRESMRLLYSASEDGDTRQLAYDFVKENFDAIVRRMPAEWGASLPQLGIGFCDTEHRADLEVFFKDKIANFNGGPRSLAQALETVGLCAAQRAARQVSVATFLKRY